MDSDPYLCQNLVEDQAISPILVTVYMYIIIPKVRILFAATKSHQESRCMSSIIANLILLMSMFTVTVSQKSDIIQHKIRRKHRTQNSNTEFEGNPIC